jgi:hypothetical protein
MVRKTKIRKAAQRVENLQNKLTSTAETLEELIEGLCDFPSGISLIPGDGICVINDDTANVAPLHTCIRWFEDHGNLSAEQHNELCI